MQQEISRMYAIHAHQTHCKPLTLYYVHVLSYRRPRLLTGSSTPSTLPNFWLMFSVDKNHCQRITTRPTHCVLVFLKASYNWRKLEKVLSPYS